MFFDYNLLYIAHESSQKNAVKAIAKIAPNFGQRMNRHFAWVVPRARLMADTCTDGSVTTAEAFTELFIHLTFHLQGKDMY